jgi:hypothetical protein
MSFMDKIKKVAKDIGKSVSTDNSVLDLRKANPFGDGGMLHADNLNVDHKANVEAQKKQEANAANQAAQDNADFLKFKQDATLLDPAMNDLNAPQFRQTSQYNKDVEAITSLFNQRKSDILARQRSPGVNQTRLF